jgi:hypothetical protein
MGLCKELHLRKCTERVNGRTFHRLGGSSVNTKNYDAFVIFLFSVIFYALFDIRLLIVDDFSIKSGLRFLIMIRLCWKRPVLHVFIESKNVRVKIDLTGFWGHDTKNLLNVVLFYGGIEVSVFILN